MPANVFGYLDIGYEELGKFLKTKSDSTFQKYYSKWGKTTHSDFFHGVILCVASFSDNRGKLYTGQLGVKVKKGNVRVPRHF